MADRANRSATNPMWFMGFRELTSARENALLQLGLPILYNDDLYGSGARVGGLLTIRKRRPSRNIVVTAERAPPLKFGASRLQRWFERPSAARG